MTPIQRAHAQIATLFVIIAGLSATGLYIAPERGSKWLLTAAIALSTMAGMWLVAAIVGRATAAKGQSEIFSRWLGPAVVWGGVLLALGVARPLVQVLGYGNDLTGDRVQQIVIGLAMAIFGNLMPKIVGPLQTRRCSAAEMQAVQRFAGWTFTLMGLGYAASWAFAPKGWADGLSTTLCAGAVVLVLGRLLLAFKPRTPA